MSRTKIPSVTEKMRPIIEQFVKDTLEFTLDSADYIIADDLYNKFKTYCQQKGLHNCTPYIFTSNMKQINSVCHERYRIPNTYKFQTSIFVYRYVKVRGA